MKTKNISVLNLVVYIIGFAAFWSVSLFFFIFGGLVSELNRMDSIFYGSRFGEPITLHLFYTPAPLGGVFVFFYTRGNLKKALLATLIGIIIISIPLLLVEYLS